MNEFARAVERAMPAGAVNRVGQVRSVLPLRVLVGATTVDASAVGNYRPSVGDSVFMSLVSGTWIVYGWVKAGGTSWTGTVVSASVAGMPGYVAVVDQYGKTHTALHVGAAPTVGQQVALDWSGSTARVLGTVGQQIPGVAPGVADPGLTMSGENYFPAYETGSFRGGAWRTDTEKPAQYRWPGESEDFGAWFYGGAPKQQLTGVVVDEAAIYLSRVAGGDPAPASAHLYHHNADNKPSGAVTYGIGPFDSPALSIGQSGYYPIPVALAQAVVGGGGIGIKGAPYAVFADRISDPNSGSLFIRWHRG